MSDDVIHDENSAQPGDINNSAAVVCPVCGSATVQEKCKVICKSDVCRGRIVYNCAEF